VIEIVAFASVQLLDVSGPLQVFSTANDIVRESGGAPPYAPRVVAQGGGDVIASAGLGIAAGRLPPLGAALDTLVIAGGDGVQAAAADPALVDWIRRRAKHARRVASVCTGAFLLAATGLLDGRRAATHWSLCDELARKFPAIRVEPDPIFVCDGALWTSAGVTAGIDLALALVEKDLGRTVALAVARYLVVFLKRPSGQAQFSTALSLQAAEDKFGALHHWIGAHLADEMSLALRRANRADAGPRRRAAQGGGGASIAVGVAPSDQANLAAVRFRFGGDDAPQLPAPARRLAAGLPRPVQFLNFLFRIMLW
jgi:transcriptional regulator GlxA family with amidase domain